MAVDHFSQHGSGPLSLMSFPRRCSFLMKTLTVLITSHAAVVGEEVQVGTKHVYPKGHVTTKFVIQRHVLNQFLVVFPP